MSTATNQLPPPPKMDKELSGHSWQDWFYKLWIQVQNMNNYDLNAIAAGQIANKSIVRVYGTTSPQTVQNARLDVWPLCNTIPTYIFPAAAARMWIVSDSANDTAAGTGVRTLMIHYLDSTYTAKEETITLNGTTAVQTVGSILRVNELHSVTVGSGGVAAGNITLQDTAAAPTNKYSYIVAGYNKSEQAVYTVPTGKTGYISFATLSSGSTSGTHYTRFFLRTTSDEDGTLYPGVFNIQAVAGSLNSNEAMNLLPPIKIPATADVKISVISDAANANVTADVFLMGWIE